MSSRSPPTSQYIIIQSQGIADQNYDSSKKFKLCRVGKTCWNCWCFSSSLSDDDAKWPMSQLPRYRRVREISVKTSGNISFLWCDCGFYDRIGIPCRHIFRVIGDMTLNMFHIRHWRYYEAYYNDNTDLGRQLVQAQKEHFDNEGLGVRLSDDQINSLLQNDGCEKHTNDGSKLSSNTTFNDWTDAKFVKDKCTLGCCLWSDLDSFILGGRTQGLMDTNDITSFIGYRECEGFTSTEARRLQSSISMSLPSHDDCDNQFSGNNEDADDSSESSNNSYDIGCVNSRDDIRQSLVSMNDSFVYNERVPMEMLNDYFNRIKMVQKEMLNTLQSDSQGCKEKREYEFACNEGTYRSPQKRKKNVLDY